MKRSTDRYLTTHVGSMIRPPKITEYVEALAAKQPIDQAAFEAELTSGVRDVVRRQVEAGVDMVSDGEFSKINWLAYFQHRCSGFETRMQPLRTPTFLGAEREGRFAEFYDQTSITSPAGVQVSEAFLRSIRASYGPSWKRWRKALASLGAKTSASNLPRNIIEPRLTNTPNEPRLMNHG